MNLQNVFYNVNIRCESQEEGDASSKDGFNEDETFKNINVGAGEFHESQDITKEVVNLI